MYYLLKTHIVINWCIVTVTVSGLSGATFLPVFIAVFIVWAGKWQHNTIDKLRHVLQSTTKYAQKSGTKQQVRPKCPYIDTTVVMKYGHLGQGHCILRQDNHAQFILLRTETMVLKVDHLVKVERKTYLSFLAMASLVLLWRAWCYDTVLALLQC